VTETNRSDDMKQQGFPKEYQSTSSMISYWCYKNSYTS